VIIVGVRSPLVVDIEETLLRLGIAVTAAVSVNGTPRMIDRSKLVELADFEAPAGAPFLVSAFAPRRRRELFAVGEALGLKRADALIDPTAILPRSIRIGAGSYINAGAVIGGLSLIGEGVFVNRAVSLGHHTVLGDFATIGPGATLAGNIHVGNDVVIGAGATIFPDIRIGGGAIISGGSVVRKHVPENMLVSGNPAVAKPFIPKRSALNLEDGE
jgi:sugar O-acyltransferase (sialic acid O-acetyltransferase NeuD family)